MHGQRGLSAGRQMQRPEPAAGRRTCARHGGCGGGAGGWGRVRGVGSEGNRLWGQRVGAGGEERRAGVVLVEPRTIDNGLLTQTVRQRRDRITARDNALILGLYSR